MLFNRQIRISDAAQFHGLERELGNTYSSSDEFA
jgi:hypothetical protein